MFLSEPRFEGLPAIFEGPGFAGKQVEPEDIAAMSGSSERGLAARGVRADDRRVAALRYERPGSPGPNREQETSDPPPPVQR